MLKPLARFATVAALLLCATAIASPQDAVIDAPGGGARDAFVLISGGGTQLSNNYSQYLQARAVAAHFAANYPPDSTWVFFGAGNTEGRAPVFSDVRRQSKQNGLVIDAWVPGMLPDNRPAKRDVILQALRDEVLPSVSGGGTLYLFVGDHGHLSRGDNPESQISLWTLEPHAGSRHGWRSNRGEQLGVTDLRDILSAGLGEGRMVFVMTQCHSGGFHYLSVPRQMTPNSAWYTAAPSLAGADAAMLPYAAGFTATDEQSLAAGCDPSPDPETWAGYERYVPENLLGMDLFSLESTGAGLPSFAAAHAAATLVDQTIDKPLATSEQYLERWAKLIEQELTESQDLTAPVRRQVAAYHAFVDGSIDGAGATTIWDAAWRERQALFSRFIRRMGEQNSGAKSLLLSGKRSELESAAGVGRGRGARRHNHGGGNSELTKLWKEQVRPAWKAVVMSGEAGLNPHALAFEKLLLAQEDKGRDLLLGRDRNAMASEVFWASGYDNPGSVDADRAAAYARWGAERRFFVQGWASGSKDSALRNAGARLAENGPRRLPDRAMPPRSLSRRIAAERTLLYRRVLGAWAFLLALDEQPALQRLEQIIELERMPLPARSRTAQLDHQVSRAALRRIEASGLEHYGVELAASSRVSR